MENLYYKVAEHVFRISTPRKELTRSFLPSYESFHIENNTEDLLFSMELVKDLEVCGDKINEFEWDGSVCFIYRNEKGYAFELFPMNMDISYQMHTNADFSEIEVTIKDKEADSFVLNNFLMMSYAFASASRKTLMIHASVIRNDGYGYLFLGKSGTGKSTHSNLWLKHIEGSDLLNDDNPIVRMMDGKVIVYGSPWSGKTACYRNLNVPVGAFLKLRQAPENKIAKDKPLIGFATVLSSCSVMKWDRRIYDGICDTVSEVTLSVPVYTLDCLPDEAAARLSYKTIHV